MRVRLVLTTYFKSILGIGEVPLELESGASVAEAVRVFLEDYPDYKAALEKRRTFLIGELRAIYMVSGMAVNSDHVLIDGDELKVMKAFIGG